LRWPKPALARSGFGTLWDREAIVADTYIQGSFAFRCAAAERDLIQEVIYATRDLSDEEEPEKPSATLLAVFPPTDETDTWSGLRGAFADPAYPIIGADFTSEDDPDRPNGCVAIFSSMIDFDPEVIAMLVHRCCKETLQNGAIGFQWAVSCSKPRIDEFGGGWCAVFPDRIEIESTHEPLSRALGGKGGNHG